jgi:hypothetical protein
VAVLQALQLEQQQARLLALLQLLLPAMLLLLVQAHLQEVLQQLPEKLAAPVLRCLPGQRWLQLQPTAAAPCLAQQS